jgi:hypothetical protein
MLRTISKEWLLGMVDHPPFPIHLGEHALEAAFADASGYLAEAPLTEGGQTAQTV